MARKATKKQVKFAEEYIKTGNGTQSALAHYDTKDPDTAASLASENLRKPKVLALIEDFAETATKNIQKLALEAENETVQLNASKDQLDRAGFKPVEKTQTVTLNINATDPKVIELAKEYEERLKKQL